MPDSHLPGQAPPRNPLTALLGLIAGGALLAAGIVFSVFLLALAALAGLLIGSYLWWRTRDLRRQLKAQLAEMEQMQGAGFPSGNDVSPGGGIVIEGEAVREREEVNRPPPP